MRNETTRTTREHLPPMARRARRHARQPRPRALLAGLALVTMLAGCSIAQTAAFKKKPESAVTNRDRVEAWNAWAAWVDANGSGGGFPSDEWFFALGRCEQPGGGYAGVAWDTHGPGYEGGLGFAVGTWDQFAPEVLASPPDNAGDARWQDQVRVARHLYALYGPSPWGCSPVAGPAY